MVDSENENQRIYLKVHGFIDSPNSLVKVNANQQTKMRINEENFLCIAYEAFKSRLDFFFKDFGNYYLIKEKKN
jgi:hypothetical protein